MNCLRELTDFCKKNNCYSLDVAWENGIISGLGSAADVKMAVVPLGMTDKNVAYSG